MFGFLKKSVSTPQPVAKPAAAVVKAPVVNDDSSDEEEEVNDTPEVASKVVDVHVESGGGKGWPSDVCTVFYHKQQGLICVGTDSGAIYTYGDGFQFMRPNTKEDNVSIKRIVALDPDLILVAYNDNSIDVLELPAMNLVGDLDKTWLGTKGGDITTIHVDEPNEKNYVYIGTSEGILHVLDINDSSNIRICDFLLTWKLLGLNNNMSITDIQICPKDEKFLAISYEGLLVDQGAVIIYDLSKMKTHRLYETKAILSLAWNHTGDILYGGTKDGYLLTMGIDKTHFSSPWNAKTELVDEDEVNDLNDEPVFIQKLLWMAPQPPSVEGCLFVLLGCPGADNDALKSVVIGLSPTGAHGGDLELVFSMPAIPQEKVLEYSLVPTYLKSEADLVQAVNTSENNNEDDENNTIDDIDNPNNTTRINIVPAILLLTTHYPEEDDDECDLSVKHLKIVRCPAENMANWAFEVGTLPEPRLATEVLAGTSSVTYVSGLVPESSILSLSSVLLKKGAESAGVITAAPRAGNNYSTGPSISAPKLKGATGSSNTSSNFNAKASRRLSTRDFFDLRQCDADEDRERDWEMVLAVGEHPDSVQQRRARLQDVVIKGYANGTVVAWGVSLPENRGNIWLPLMSMRCGKNEVTSITHDETAGLMAAGDETGVLVIWEIYEEASNMSSSEVLRQVNNNATTVANSKAREISMKNQDNYENNSNNSDDEDNNSDTEPTGHLEGPAYAMYSTYDFNNVREVLRTRLHDHITATLLIPQFTSIIVGTLDGTVYICTQYTSVLFSEIEGLDSCGGCGAVVGLTYGTFLLAERYSVAAIYIAYANGNVAVVQLSTLQLIAYSPSLDASYLSMLNDTDTSTSSSTGSSNNQYELCLTDGKYNQMQKPLLKDVALVIAQENLISRSSTPNNDNNATNNTTTNNTTNNNDTTSPFRGFKPFSQVKTSLDKMKIDMDKAAKDAAKVLKIPLPSDKNEQQQTIYEKIKNKKRIPFHKITRYMIIIIGKLLLTYDLHRFIRVTTKTCLIGHRGNAINIKIISKKSILITKFLNYIPYNSNTNTIDSDNDDDNENKMLIACCINKNGLLIMISIKEKALINHTQLITEIDTDTTTSSSSNNKNILDYGSMLSNGNCYLVQSGGEILYSYTINLLNSSLKLYYSLPDRSSPNNITPKTILMLKHGRETMIANQKEAIRKRRTSIMKISTPFDLSKIFSKTRDQRLKDELLNRNHSNDDNNTTSGTSNSMWNNNTNNTTTKTNKTMNNLSETREAFEQRGEKINRAAIKADEIKDSASQFSKVVKEQKEALKSKNKRWGLF